MSPHRQSSVFRYFLALVLVLATASLHAKPSNKWRLEFSGGADSDGSISLRITPEGGEPLGAQIDITRGTGENAVAKAVTRGLKAQLPEDSFKVERDDGEDVLIKKRRGAEDFDVEILENTVEGVRIHPQHE